LPDISVHGGVVRIGACNGCGDAQERELAAGLDRDFQRPRHSRRGRRQANAKRFERLARGRHVSRNSTRPLTRSGAEV
jgi:hypothetical protein